MWQLLFDKKKDFRSAEIPDKSENKCNKQFDRNYKICFQIGWEKTPKTPIPIYLTSFEKSNIYQITGNVHINNKCDIE